MKENADYFKEDDNIGCSLLSGSGSNLKTGSNAGSMMDISTSPPTMVNTVSTDIAIGVNQDHRTLTSTSLGLDSDFFTCILCLEQHNINAFDRFLLLGAFVQKSTVLSQNRSRKSWMYSSTSTFIQEQLKNICMIESDLNYGPHMNTCTHYMHSDCFQKYIEMIHLQERRRATGRHLRFSYDINKGEFLCPLCECLCNIAIPIVPQTVVRKGSHPTDLPMEKFLSGLNSILGDSACDGSNGWLDIVKYMGKCWSEFYFVFI